MSDEYTFTDLSERLREPDGRAAAGHCKGRLAELDDLVGKRLADGLAPGEYERYRQLSAALAAAQRIMVLLAKPLEK